MSDLVKNEKIKQTLALTKIRRKSQQCKVFELKIDKSKLSKNCFNKLTRLFLEAKWFYNFCISQDHVFDFDSKIKTVLIKNKDLEFEERNLNILSSQIKQGLHSRILGSIKSEATKKKRNKGRIGKLKFKSVVNSIPLKQFDNTYKIIDKNKIQIQGIKNKIYVSGLKQIPVGAEFANANLIRRHGDFYLKVTTFVEKEINLNNINRIGLDFGIKTQLAFSNGIKLESKIPVSKRSLLLHKNLSRSKKSNGLKSRTKNQFKIREKLVKSYERTSNQKRDVKNKIVHELKTNFNTVAIQNENIKAWHHGWFGKQVQESAIGGIISGIKMLPQTHVVDRFFPSTKLCPCCGKLNKIGLSERVYKCSCGYECDRDIHSATNILNEAIPTERREFKPVGNSTSILMYDRLKRIPHIKVSTCSMKQEAQVFRLG